MAGSPLAKRAAHSLSWKACEHIGTQVIFLVRLVILARLLVPEDFGLIAIGLSAIGVLRAVTELGLLPALVQRSNLDQDHYDSAWTAGLLRGLVVCVLTVLCAPLIADLFAEPRATPIIQALALILLVEMTASIKLADLLRRVDFRPVAFVGLSQALVNTIAAAVTAPTLGVWALVLGALSGAATHTVLSYIVAPYRPSFKVSRQHLFQLVRFGRWILLNGWIVVIGASLLRVIITRKLGVAELGLFFLASKLAFLPAIVASEVVGQVAFPLFARIKSDDKETTAAFQGLFSATFIIFAPACVLLIVVAPNLVDMLLGARWQGTAPMIQILAAASLFGLFGDAAAPLFQGRGAMGKLSSIELIQVLALLPLAWILVDLYGFIGVGYAYVIALAMSQALGIVFIERMLESPFQGILALLSTVAVITAASGLLATLVLKSVTGLLGLSLAVGLSSGFFLATLFIMDRWLDLRIVIRFKLVFSPLLRRAGVATR